MSSQNGVTQTSGAPSPPPGRRFEVEEPVRWLEPGELFRSLVRLVVASTFGQYADRREMMAGLKTIDHDERQRQVDNTLWVDFVADLGDGFDSTVSVAEVVARENIELDEAAIDMVRRERAKHDLHQSAVPELPRAGVLVMGGDEVYPYATKGAYLRRTVGPYEAVLPMLGEGDNDEMSVYALPGNHDWYDGLSAFQKVFCTEQWMGGWKSKQTRSYFGIRLTDNCWLWGVDIALGEHFDRGQIDYFEEQAASLAPGDAVILCIAKPCWEAEQNEPDHVGKSLTWFQHKIIQKNGAKVVAVLSGDRHFYARRTADPSPLGPQHLIIAGGGGAYLSSPRGLEQTVTLAAPGSEPQRQWTASYEQMKTYPTEVEATRLAWRKAWGRILTTWQLVSMIATIYLIFGLLLRAGADASEADPFDSIAHLDAILSPSPLLAPVGAMGLLIGMGLYALARHGKASKKQAVAITLVHLSAHGAGVLLSTLAGQWLATTVHEPTGVLGPAAIAVSGGLAGTLIFISYLLLVQYKQINLNELFSGIRFEGYKNFVRMAVRNDHVEIFAIGLDSVSRRWIDWTDDGPKVRGKPSQPRLIDYLYIPISTRHRSGQDDSRHRPRSSGTNISERTISTTL